MEPHHRSAVGRTIRRLADRQRDQHDSDRDLLLRFTQQRDESAFGVLVGRHAPLVMGVALRVLRHHQDAEDVCQATFLLLARKAKGTAWRESIATWLYRAAYQLSLKAQRAARRRSMREAKAEARIPPDPLAELSVRDLQQVFDEELGRLADKYRAPLILCCLDGKSRDEAARCLGVPLSTVISRLEKGRELLRRRLAGRGVPLGVAVASVTVLAEASRAAVPAGVLETIRATAVHAAFGALTTEVVSAQVLDLLRGGTQMMLLGKLKVTAIALAVAGLFALFLGSSIVRARHADETGAPAAPAAQTASGGTPAKGAPADGKRIQGAWLVDAATVDGKNPKDAAGVDFGPLAPGSRWVFAGNKVTLRAALHQPEDVRGHIDPQKDPKTIDLHRGEQVIRGIYQLKGDTLTLCLAMPGKAERPKEFQAKAASGMALLTLKRDAGQPRGKLALTEEALEIANRQQRNRLKQILLAFRNYEAEHGRLPAAAICDKDGKPLLSWRVTLLEKLGNNDLLAEFHRNEPWHSAHNKQLLRRMPAVYAPLQPDPKKPHTTCWQVFTGKGTLFESTEGMRLKDIRNDKAILCVEGAEPVPWTKPDDLAYGAKKPLPKLGGHYPTGFFIGMLDCDARFVNAKFNERILRRAISREDDGKFDRDDLDNGNP